MNERASSTLARLIAPIALLAAALALVIVVASSLDLSGDGGGSGAAESTIEIQPEEEAGAGFGRRYVVKPGDSLSTIAEETGVPVDELVELNPEIDPQALISGVSVKLR